MRPDDLQYTKEHEWVRLEEGEATVGITDFAAGEIGDIVYIDLPETGRQISAGEALGTIETVKAVEEIYAPLSGVVVAVNQTLQEHPEQINEDPFGEGWIVRLQPTEDGAEELMSAGEYNDMIGEE